MCCSLTPVVLAAAPLPAAGPWRFGMPPRYVIEQLGQAAPNPHTVTPPLPGGAGGGGLLPKIHGLAQNQCCIVLGLAWVEAEAGPTWSSRPLGHVLPPAAVPPLHLVSGGSGSVGVVVVVVVVEVVQWPTFLWEGFAVHSRQGTLCLRCGSVPLGAA